jgi:hypothetical protein
MTENTATQLSARYQKAKQNRSTWESHWQECYDFALPHKGNASGLAAPGSKQSDKLFDGTAPDGVEQLAASLLSQLTPPWARWFGFTEGPDLTDEERPIVAPELERAAAALQSNFDRSNFAIEMHQCYLDLVTVGSACLLFQEAEPGAASAFRFTAVPLSEVVFEENAFGQLETTYRRSELTLSQIRTRFPDATLPTDLTQNSEKNPDMKIGIIEAVVPSDQGFTYSATTESRNDANNEVSQLAHGKFRNSPFINFRWLKAPGETYGRSPVMKALPDIKTANKVVELILKNASIAVTGIWQADDDGVLNPANIKLKPGTIIPKAVGSAGLTPLEAPGKFDLSQLILQDLRKNIRRALLADKLGQPEEPRMTATEVVERSADMARLLGATYGRLQSELLTPLVNRSLEILKRRGEVADIQIDGRTIDLEYKSPLARQQAREDTQNTIHWLEAIQVLGPEGMGVIDHDAAARWLARAFGVPGSILRDPQPAGLEGLPPELTGVADLFNQMASPEQEMTGPEALPMVGQVPMEMSDE